MQSNATDRARSNSWHCRRAACRGRCNADVIGEDQDRRPITISGKNGNALLDAMDRRGPKHGFLTHAIAQTSYTIAWEIDWKEQAGSCRVANAAATLTITYTYPQVHGHDVARPQAPLEPLHGRRAQA